MPIGGGGGGGGPTQSTSYQTNLPEYARPYVETMLGATQKQLFEGTPTEGGGFNITGFKPYQPYPGIKTAEFQPLQERAFGAAENMGPSGQLSQATGLAGLAGTEAFRAGQYTPGYFGTSSFTQPGAAGQYMSPFIEQALAPQLREAERTSRMRGLEQQAQAVGRGAFGGSREALMRAERERNLGIELDDIRAKGLQSAYDRAQDLFSTEQQRALQAQQLGEQSRQFGAGLGLQGLGTAISAAGQLGQLGQQQFGQEKETVGLQSQLGAQQQALEQQKISQAMQDYATAQQYPLMQLGFMSNMLRGLPMQAVNTQQYMAQPSYLTQGIGALGAGASLYNAFGKKEGGQIKEYDVGGEVREDLEQMDNAALERYIKESQSDTAKRIAQRILRERGLGMAGGGIVAFAKGSDGPVTGLPGSLMALELGEESIAAEPASPEQIREMTTKELQEYNRTGKIPERVVDLSQDNVARALDRQMAPAVGSGIGAKPRTDTADVRPAPASAPAAPAAASAASAAPARAGLKLEDFMYQDSEKPQGLLDLQQQTDEAQSLARRTQAEHLADIRKEYGDLASSKARQDYRQKVMEERANAKDETRRNRDLLMAQAFADMATRPGPVLVAMMGAVKDRLPDVIANEKDLKKAQREMDRVVFELDEATRLEERGLADKAYARKEDALKRVNDLSVKFATQSVEFERQREANKAAAQRAFGQEKGHMARTEMEVAARDRATEATEKARIQQQLEANARAAETNLRTAETALTNQLGKNPAYIKAVQYATMPIADNASKETRDLQAQGAADKKRMEEDLQKSLRDYRRRLTDAQNRAAGVSPEQARAADPLYLMDD